MQAGPVRQAQFKWQAVSVAAAPLQHEWGTERQAKGPERTVPAAPAHRRRQGEAIVCSHSALSTSSQQEQL